ncbi:MAG: S4 domain-containing protein [Promethearchaeota archaeon]
MGRLDIYLVELGLIPTRSRAKRAILYGLIQVNGKTIKKPAYSVKKKDKIEVISEIATKPVGYWKLHVINNLFKIEIFNSKATVLDLGSSAGGFLEFAATHCKRVFGVEISNKFTPILYQLKKQYTNISILISDVYMLDSEKNLKIDQVDIILNDLTLEPIESTKILLKFLPLLKKRGYIIMSIKQGKYSLNKCKIFIENSLIKADLNILKILDIDPDKKELHIIAQKQ